MTTITTTMKEQEESMDMRVGGSGSGDRGEGEGMDDGEIQVDVDEDTQKLSFDDLGLHEDLLRGIFSYGFERPSAIQARAIRPVAMGRDVIAQAQSGTGKTATFAIGILQQIDVKLRACQAVVLAPTRELAGQITDVFTALSTYMGIKVHMCVGGTDMRESIRELRGGVHVVVGTPGRVKDMIDVRKALRVKDVKVFCLDEADEMLSRGFLGDVQELFQVE